MLSIQPPAVTTYRISGLDVYITYWRTFRHECIQKMFLQRVIFSYLLLIT